MKDGRVFLHDVISALNSIKSKDSLSEYYLRLKQAIESFQKGTRQLSWICEELKTRRASAATLNVVPQLKKDIEKLIFTIKTLFQGADGFNLPIGTLLQKNVDGTLLKDIRKREREAKKSKRAKSKINDDETKGSTEDKVSAADTSNQDGDSISVHQQIDSTDSRELPSNEENGEKLLSESLDDSDIIPENTDEEDADDGSDGAESHGEIIESKSKRAGKKEKKNTLVNPRKKRKISESLVESGDDSNIDDDCSGRDDKENCDERDYSHECKGESSILSDDNSTIMSD